MGHIHQESRAERGPATRLDADRAEAGVGLDDRLRAFVARPSDDPNRTWAERILGSLVAGAVRGDARSQQQVFRRIGAPATSHQDVQTFPIDDATARKVLEAVRGPVKDRSVA